MHVAPGPGLEQGGGGLAQAEVWDGLSGEGGKGSVLEGGGAGGGGGGGGGIRVCEGGRSPVHDAECEGCIPEKINRLVLRDPSSWLVQFGRVWHRIMAEHHTLEHDIFGDGSELSSEEEGPFMSPCTRIALTHPQTSPSTASARGHPPSTRMSLPRPGTRATHTNRSGPQSKSGGQSGATIAMARPRKSASENRSPRRTSQIFLQRKVRLPSIQPFCL